MPQTFFFSYLFTIALASLPSSLFAIDEPASDLDLGLLEEEDGVTEENPESSSPPREDQLGELPPLDDPGEWDTVSSSSPSPLDSIKIEEIVEPPTQYHYSAFGQPDPFQRPSREVTIKVARANEQAKAGEGQTEEDLALSAEIPVVNPLQRYPLGELELKGILLNDQGDRKALMMTPKKEGVLVKEGDPVSAGKLLHVKKDHIVVRQYSIRANGAREYQDETLYLGNAVRDDKAFVTLKPGEEPVFTPEEEINPAGPARVGIGNQGLFPPGLEGGAAAPPNGAVPQQGNNNRAGNPAAPAKPANAPVGGAQNGKP